MTPELVIDQGVANRLQRAWLWYQARQGRQMSQGELADLLRRQAGLGVSQVHIGRWLNGKRAVPTRAIPALAHVLGIERAWLAFGADGGLPDPPWYRDMLEAERAVRELGALADEEDEAP